MEQINQQAPQQVNQPVQTSVENPVPKKTEVKPKKNFSLTIILSFTTIIATLIAGFFYFQNTKLRTELIKKIESIPTPTSIPSPTEAPDETIDWKTYTNDKYKITFKYPQNWTFFSESSEKYNNPNKNNGYAYMCLVNFNQVFLMQNKVNTPWGPLSSFFDLQISVTNPNKWTLEEWVNKCRSFLETENAEYARKVVTINNKESILFYKEGPPGNGGEATHYIYIIKADNKFYWFSFTNHKYLTGDENTIDTLLKTINFL